MRRNAKGGGKESIQKATFLGTQLETHSWKVALCGKGGTSDRSVVCGQATPEQGQPRRDCSSHTRAGEVQEARNSRGKE